MNDRLIDVSWNNNTNTKFQTNINILANPRENLLLDIISKTSGTNINIIKVDTKTSDDKVIYKLLIEVENTEILNRYISSVNQVVGVISAQRFYN